MMLDQTSIADTSGLVRILALILEHEQPLLIIFVLALAVMIWKALDRSMRK